MLPPGAGDVCYRLNDQDKIVFVNEAWAKVEEAVSHLGLFDRHLLPQLTHGICEDCHARIVRTLQGTDEQVEPRYGPQSQEQAP